MTESRLTERLDRVTFNKGTDLIKSFNPGTIFSNDTLDAWFSELKHLDAIVFMVAIRHICKKVKWFYNTNLAFEIDKLTPDIISRKSEQETPLVTKPVPTAVEQSRSQRFFECLRISLGGTKEQREFLLNWTESNAKSRLPIDTLDEFFPKGGKAQGASPYGEVLKTMPA